MRATTERGVTLIEITVVLAAVAILSAAMAPVASRTIERSRLARAVTDAQAITTALSNYVTDAAPAFRQPRLDGTDPGSDEVDLLVSDGDIPESSISTEWAEPTWIGAILGDFLENHVAQNEPFDQTAAPYPTSWWRGAYINAPINPDPWGNRYAVNAEWLNGTAAEMMNDTFVVSAGPNEQVDTAWEQNGAVPGGDDIIIIIRRDTGLVVP